MSSIPQDWVGKMPTYQGQYVPGQVLDAADLNAFHPYFSWQGSNLTSVANATFVKLTTTSGSSTDNLTWFSSGNARVTPNIQGQYMVTASCLTGTTSTRSIMAIYKNGAVYSKNDFQVGITGMVTAQMLSCNGTTDYIEIFVYQQSGLTQNYGDFKWTVNLVAKI